MIEIEDAKYLDDYKVWMRFNTGEEGVADLEDSLWGPVFEPLKNIDAFKNFTVSDTFHTIVWENGADLAPEHLYEKALGKKQAADSPKNQVPNLREKRREYDQKQ